MVSLTQVVSEVKGLMAQGITEPQALFDRIYYQTPVHYATVRKAIHIAKSSIFKDN